MWGRWLLLGVLHDDVLALHIYTNLVIHGDYVNCWRRERVNKLKHGSALDAGMARSRSFSFSPFSTFPLHCSSIDASSGGSPGEEIRSSGMV